MSRREFSIATKKAAHDRADGTCECGCQRPFSDHPRERPEYHHRIEAYLGGGNDLDNCLCIRVDCHSVITAKESAPKAAKVRREGKRRQGLAPRKAKIAGSKGTGWRRPLNGPAYRVKD